MMMIEAVIQLQCHEQPCTISFIISSDDDNSHTSLMSLFYQSHQEGLIGNNFYLNENVKILKVYSLP